MGALLGLGFGAGVLVVWQALAGFGAPREPRRRASWLAGQIDAAGLEAVKPGRVALSCAGAGVAVAMVSLVATRTLPVALAFGLFAAYAPVGLIRLRARGRRRELREHWPDVVDNLASAVRAGLSLPDALTQLGRRGPEPLRRPFERFGQDYRASGRFHDCLDALKARLCDPTGDRVVESLRVARDVGGNDLGRLLRTLSMFLRDEIRVRAELETRQGWVVNAARLAVAAPWILLALLSLRSSAIQAFNSPAGWLLLAIGAGLCLLAYRLMVRLGRLPDDERVLG